MAYFFTLLLGLIIIMTSPSIYAAPSNRTGKATAAKPKKVVNLKLLDPSLVKATSDMHTDAVIPGCFPEKNLMAEVAAVRKKKGFDLFGLLPSGEQKILTLTAGEYVKSKISIGDARDIESRRIDSNNLITNKPLQDYANAILACLKKASGVDNVPGSVYITLTDDYFAQSSADGNIFIAPAWFTGDDNNEEVIAMLLAHELAHVLLHHHDLTLLARVQKLLQYYWTAGATIRNQLEERKQKDDLTPQQYKELAKMQLLIEGSEQILLPAWQRKQESEADALAIDLFVLAGYKNMKAANIFIRSLGETEKKAAQTRAQELAAIEQQNVALISEGKFGDALKLGISDALKSIRVALAEKHPEHKVREVAMQEYAEKFWPFERINREPEPGTATTEVAARPEQETLSRLKKHRDVAILKDEVDIFATGYDNLKQRNFDVAQLAFNRLMQGNLLSNHAHVIFSFYLSKKHLQQADAHEILKKSFLAPDQAWKPYAEYARASHNRQHKEKTTALINEAHEKFRHSPALLPKLIGLYAEFSMSDEANELTNKCVAQSEAVDYRAACLKAKETKPNPSHMAIFEANVGS